MLLKRLDVTVQSFKWSEKGKVNRSKFPLVDQFTYPCRGPQSQLDKMEAVYRPNRQLLSPTVSFSPYDVLFAPRGKLLRDLLT